MSQNNDSLRKNPKYLSYFCGGALCGGFIVALFLVPANRELRKEVEYLKRRYLQNSSDSTYQIRMTAEQYRLGMVHAEAELDAERKKAKSRSSR